MRRKSRAFARVIDRGNASAERRLDGLRLDDLLVMPVQRLPQYRMVLAKLCDMLSKQRPASCRGKPAQSEADYGRYTKVR